METISESEPMRSIETRLKSESVLGTVTDFRSEPKSQIETMG